MTPCSRAKHLSRGVDCKSIEVGFGSIARRPYRFEGAQRRGGCREAVASSYSRNCPRRLAGPPAVRFPDFASIYSVRSIFAGLPDNSGRRRERKAAALALSLVSTTGLTRGLTMRPRQRVSRHASILFVHGQTPNSRSLSRTNNCRTEAPSFSFDRFQPATDRADQCGRTRTCPML
jgi:hypothetical protein